MNFRLCVIRVLLCAACGALPGWADEAESPHEFATSAKCKTCHITSKVAGVHYQHWLESAHSKAFRTLYTKRSAEIAAAAGVGAPTQAQLCLQCHATTVKWTEPKMLAEGVGCERCHGPGEDYAVLAIMRDAEKAHALGLKRYEGDSEEAKLKSIEAQCLECHGPGHKDKFPNEASYHLKDFDFPSAWEAVKHDDAVLRARYPDQY